MKRWAVKVTCASTNEVVYVAIGKGLSKDPQEAHLYAHRRLAEAQEKFYGGRGSQWYKDFAIVEVDVTGL